jgi:hypothetical protein
MSKVYRSDDIIYMTWTKADYYISQEFHNHLTSVYILLNVAPWVNSDENFV